MTNHCRSVRNWIWIVVGNVPAVMIVAAARDVRAEESAVPIEAVKGQQYPELAAAIRMGAAVEATDRTAGRNKGIGETGRESSMAGRDVRSRRRVQAVPGLRKSRIIKVEFWGLIRR
ncbi:hypothetical protein TRIP_C30136 [Candidatus Zixiibacteriota bacterium]|nr:hypothetical protein TRIP_C30136 [candidate division Zixibacteria bacterium]